jgi:protein-S-isoprenylcysteine O-methyltransferase Ste14
VNDDHVFRLILILGFVAVLPVGVYHRLKAATPEKLDRKQEGIVILVSIRLLGLVGMVGLLAFMIDPTWMAWASVLLAIWLRWVGVAFFILGASFLTWTFRNLGKNITDTVVTRKEHSLVTTGPYRWVRHPFYVSFALFVLATFLVSANWFILITLSVVLLLLVIRTNKEEEKLIERFGDEYRNYMEQTGRFWPRFVRREPKKP